MRNNENGAKKVLKKHGAKLKHKFFTPVVITATAFICMALALCAVVVVLNGIENANESERLEIIKSSTFHDGIIVSGVNISGKTYEEALSLLAPVEQELASQIQFSLAVGEDTYNLDASNFHVIFNTEELLDEAIQLGRNGGLLSLRASINEFESSGKQYEVDYVLDTAPLSDCVAEIAGKIYVAPVNASAKIDTSSTNYNSVIKGYPFTFEDGTPGKAVDSEALYDLLIQRADNRDFGTLEVPIIEVEPEITRSEIENNVVLLGYFDTYFKDSSSNRIYNVKKAAGLVNHTVVQPGESFYTNSILGPRTYARGWLDAPAVIGGGAATELQAGGGVCQVSTTLYNAVIMSDLKIIDRRNHSKKSAYVAGGLDATINTGTIDFVWQNNTDYPVYVFSWTNDSTRQIYCAIYGAPFPSTFDNITFTSKLIQEIQPTEAQYRTNSKLTGGQWYTTDPIVGRIYESYANYYKNGTLVNTRVVATSKYNMHPRYYYVAPGFSGPLDPANQGKLDANGNWVPLGGGNPEPSLEPSPTDELSPSPDVSPGE